MILVADSSALVALSLCNALQFLDVLFGVAKVPSGVFDEVTREHKKESINLFKYLEDKVEPVNIKDFFIRISQSSGVNSKLWHYIRNWTRTNSWLMTAGPGNWLN